MIASPQNEKLKLVRKLRERKHREREGLFATEGEDLLQAGLAAGAEPRLVLLAAGSNMSISVPVESVVVEEVEPELLADVSTLGSGTRVLAVWPQRWAEAPTAPCVYLHAIADPGNVGAILRSADAFLAGSLVLGPDCADPHSPKAVRASMGSIFSRPILRGKLGETPSPRVALVAHGGAGLEALDDAATLCLGAERQGLPEQVLAKCDARATIPLRAGGPESLNVAAAAAIACQRISSPAMREERPDA
jgi:TrmH family RNA methyltransferase